MPSQTYASYAMGPVWVSFSFKIKPTIDSIMLMSYGVCFLFSDSHVAAVFTSEGSTAEVTSQPFRGYPWQAHISSGAGLWPMQGMHQVPASSTVLNRGELPCTHLAVPSHSTNVVEYIALGA